MRYRVTHRTEYLYDAVVSTSYGQAHLLPRDTPGQRTSGTSVTIVPAPSEQREHIDFFGNRTLYFSVMRPHTRLTVTATSEVDVAGTAPDVPLLANQSWDSVRNRLRASFGGGNGARAVDEILDARQFVLDSPRAAASPALHDYAMPSFPSGRPIMAAVADLAHRIHADFVYEPGATSVTTTLDEVLESRKGVCQDFAHLAIASVRSLGLAARYVSGYLETDPPPGRPKLQGADVSHAWMAVFVPDVGWVHLDPTNDQFTTDRYVTTAWGRDYEDVPPLKGVIFSESKATELAVHVDVVAI